MPPDFAPTVYLLASRRNGTLYIGVTSNLIQRIYQHRMGLFPGFTQKYAIKRLVWFEPHMTMEQAILREKRIKKWNRAWKLDLIEQQNDKWRDLAEDLGFEAMADTRFPLSRD
ncbi:MAG: GIY-YIG nuclease family protein [Sphingopyxis sp.]